MTKQQIIQSIEDCAARHGLKPGYVARMATGNFYLYSRLKGGMTCSIDMAERLRAGIKKIDTERAARARSSRKRKGAKNGSDTIANIGNATE